LSSTATAPVGAVSPRRRRSCVRRGGREPRRLRRGLPRHGRGGHHVEPVPLAGRPRARRAGDGPRPRPDRTVVRGGPRPNRDAGRPLPVLRGVRQREGATRPRVHLLDSAGGGRSANRRVAGRARRRRPVGQRERRRRRRGVARVDRRLCHSRRASRAGVAQSTAREDGGRAEPSSDTTGSYRPDPPA